MGEKKLKRTLGTDNTFSYDEYSHTGYCLKFISGPELTKDVEPGSWLNSLQFNEGKVQFTFGPSKTLTFVSKEAAEAVRKELEKAVDILTEIAE
ncbi:MAG TPA: hypothetical protein VIH76_07255 [Candidatus Acidoferrales bacterium]